MRALVLGATMAILLAAAPVSASAESATGPQVRALARRAVAGDADAVAQLRRIDRVDGVPVDLRLALAARSAVVRRARLRVLAAPEPAQGVDATRARSDAAHIVAQARFQQEARTRSGALRQPGFLHRTWDRIGRFLRRLFAGGGSSGGALPGWVKPIAWLVAIALLAVALFFVVRSLTGWRRSPKAPKRPKAAAFVETRASAEDLLLRAEEAERDGRLEQALRFRFRAGLRRLQERRLVPWRDSLTSREVSRKLRLAEFDELARTFDEVAYGRREPRLEDVAAARETWPRVLEQAGGR